MLLYSSWSTSRHPCTLTHLRNEQNMEAFPNKSIYEKIKKKPSRGKSMTKRPGELENAGRA